MKYIDALELLLAGHAVRNTDWLKTSLCIIIDKEKEEESQDSRFVTFFNQNGYHFKWSPYITDLTSENWVLADDEFAKLKEKIKEKQERHEQLARETYDQWAREKQQMERDAGMRDSNNDIKPTFYQRVYNKIKSFIDDL